MQSGKCKVQSAELGASVEIREVATRRDLDRFVRVPWRTNASDPNWVPRLIVEVREFLDPKRHPFYLHGAAAKFLALRGGEDRKSVV